MLKNLLIKGFWINIIGICLPLILLINCSNDPVYHSVKSKWIYINETAHFISYSKDQIYLNDNFSIKPFDTIVYEEIFRDANPTTIESFSSPLMPYIIYYGTSLCDTLPFDPYNRNAEGPGGINNYTVRKSGSNNFEFTYRFTNKDVEKADTCK